MRRRSAMSLYTAAQGHKRISNRESTCTLMKRVLAQAFCLVTDALTPHCHECNTCTCGWRLSRERIVNVNTEAVAHVATASVYASRAFFLNQPSRDNRAALFPALLSCRFAKSSATRRVPDTSVYNTPKSESAFVFCHSTCCSSFRFRRAFCRRTNRTNRTAYTPNTGYPELSPRFPLLQPRSLEQN